MTETGVLHSIPSFILSHRKDLRIGKTCENVEALTTARISLQENSEC